MSKKVEQTEVIEAVAVAIFNARFSDGRNAYDLEPGNDPYHNNEEVIDQVVHGEPHFYQWRLYVKEAKAAIAAYEAAKA